MSDQAKKERTAQDIQNEYSNACLKAGNLQYEIICKSNDLKLVNDRLRELNFEFIKIKNMEAEVSRKMAEAKAAEEAAVTLDSKPVADVVPIS